MNKEMIINASDEKVEIALLEDKKLVELHYDKNNAGYAVGDLYLGKIKKLMPGLNAVFVDVGYEKDAFLHYTDLSPYIRSLLKFTKLSINDNTEQGFAFEAFQNEPEIQKNGKITDVFQGKPEILVQILKEPISNKGPRLSCEISLAGRYVVLTPFNDFVSISRKIHSNDERKRLQKIVESIKPKNFGVIVRTVAEGKNTAELHKDLSDLFNQWKNIQQKLKKANAPTRIQSEKGKATSILRDLLNSSFQNIFINDATVLAETKEYVAKIAPDKENIIHLYNNQRSIFDHYGVTKQVKSSFGKTVNMDSGAYLIIEHTEAMHVIDVNSGTRAPEANQEDTALQTNLESAVEIARQMRLRDLGGIVIIDFIDMKVPEHRKILQDKMYELMKEDRAKHTILPISKFGLMQITRQRLKPEINITTAEACPSCQGTGKIGPSLLLAEEIEKEFRYLLNQGHKNLLFKAHPMLVAYLKAKGFWRSTQWKWYRKYNNWLEMVAENDFHLVEYYFIDKKTEEVIKL